MDRKILILVVVLFMGWGPGVQAGFIEEAADAFSAMDFERALELLQRALEKGGNGPGELVRLYSLRGQCQVLLGRLPQARESFRAALSIDPAYRLPPDASPRLSQPFADALAEKTPAVELRLEFERLTAQRPPVVRLRLVDPAQLAAWVVIYARWSGSEKFTAMRHAASAAKMSRVQLSVLKPPAPESTHLEYYAELLDRYANRLALRADRIHPLRVGLEKEDAPLPPPVTAAPAPFPAAAPAWYSKWWVWAIIGTAAAAAGGITAGVMLSRPAPGERDFGVVVR